MLDSFEVPPFYLPCMGHDAGLFTQITSDRIAELPWTDSRIRRSHSKAICVYHSVSLQSDRTCTHTVIERSICDWIHDKTFQSYLRRNMSYFMGQPMPIASHTFGSLVPKLSRLWHTHDIFDYMILVGTSPVSPVVQ